MVLEDLAVAYEARKNAHNKRHAQYSLDKFRLRIQRDFSPEMSAILLDSIIQNETIQLEYKENTFCISASGLYEYEVALNGNPDMMRYVDEPLEPFDFYDSALLKVINIMMEWM